MMKTRIELFFLAVLLSTCACGNKGPELPEVDPSTFKRYSQDNVMHSDILKRDILYSIYFPENYMVDKEKRYGVVYMLHGLGDDNNSWNGNYLHANSKIDKMTSSGISEMIYVYPQGFSSYYCNRYDGTFSYMDMFIQEFIPTIDKTLRTIPDKQHRAITGYSMGGFGAIALAEKNPDMFIACAPLSMSVRTDWQYMEESPSGWQDQWGKIFGPANASGPSRISEYYKQHCPIYYFNDANREALSTVNWYLICGDDESNLLYANDTLHCVMADHGYKHEWRVVDGGHSSSVWNPALEEVLPMFDYYMNGGNLWTPTKKLDWTPATVQTETDGTWLSDIYKTNGTGTAVFIVHTGKSEAFVTSVMNALLRPSSKTGYALLPCDLSQKSLNDWMSIWKVSHPYDKQVVVAIGEGGAETMAMGPTAFDKSYYIDAATGMSPMIVKDQEIYFAGTDESPYYNDLDALYCACKKNGAKFQYRVINSNHDNWYDILKCIDSIKTYISY